MNDSTLIRNPLLAVICVLAAFLAACSGPSQLNSSTSSPYVIDPVFQQFYNFLGGQARLGVALSPVILEGNAQKQFLENALMVYDPSLPPSEQYSLASLGRQMGVWDEPLASTDLHGVYFVDGYIVYDGFVELYEQMGAQRYVGSPLTGVRYNGEQKRVEQYFENLGFYQNLEGSDRSLQLMPYGRLACAGTCAAQANPASIVQNDLPYGEPFVSTVGRLGEDFTGPRLAGPYRRANGSLEVIYKNIVLVALSEDSKQATLMSITIDLGILPEPLVTQLDNPNVMFHSVDGDLGYNVPLFFSNYIALHGGFEASGQPISELKMEADGGASQCFANACLHYASNSGVVPLPLGAQYKARFYDQPAAEAPSQQVEIRIQVWEDFSQISSSQQQIIHASLVAGNQLLEGLQPYLEITLPGSSTSIYQFPATAESGQTQLTIPPVRAQNGTLIPYKVCLEGFGAEKVCASESFMIWGN